MEPFDAPDPANALPPPIVAGGPGATPEAQWVPSPVLASRSRKGRLFGALGAVAVLAVGGVIVVNNISSASGGFDSPQAAVTALFKAAEQEDILGVVDVLRPGERSMVRDTLLPLEQQMERLAVLDKSVDMHKLPGLQVTVAGLTSTTDALADRVAVVTLTGGTITANATIADLPLGKLVRDQIDKGGSPATTSGPTTEQLKGVKIATVKEDGRWYVSYGYSIAEDLRTSAGKPVPDFAHPIPAPGADSPEGAVKGLTDAISSLDLAGMIGSLAPGEFAALHDYGTLFVPDAQKRIDSWKGDSGVKISVTEGTPTVDQHGDTAYVTFATAAVSATWSDGSLSMSIDGKGCATVKAEVSGTTTADKTVCAGDATKDTGVPADVQPILERLKDVTGRVVVVRENGHWYVAPVRTMFDLVDQALSAFKSFDDLKTVGNWISTSFADTIFGNTDSSYSDCGAEVLTVNTAIQAYSAANGRYPATLDELVPDYLFQVPTADGASGAGTYDAGTGTYTADPSVGDCSSTATTIAFPGDTVPFDTTPSGTTPGGSTTDTFPNYPTDLSPALKAFDAAYRTEVTKDGDPAKALTAMSAAGAIPAGARFFDYSGKLLPVGVFDNVLGMQLDDGSGPACMVLSFDGTISSFPIPCPSA